MSIHIQKTVRYTLEMPQEMHRCLKIACAEDGISMHTFVTRAIENEFISREERLDEEAFDRAEKDIQEHGTISMDEMDKAMGL